MKQQSLRRILLGAPLHSGAAPHQRLSNLVALPVFSSDALSSVAYATQQTMIALAVAGWSLFYLTTWISGAIVFLLLIVTISYNQTIHAYPSGGGAYIVARDNLGVLASEVAAVALLTDYILTVAVSVSSGIDAVLSAYPAINDLPIRLGLNVCATLFIMLMNLRGVKESGAAFALPTYVFVVSFLTMIGMGAWQLSTGTHEFHHLSMTPHPEITAVEGFGILLLLKAFANGCTALTGVEAISNGIPAFRPPESKNAAMTMRMMVTLLATMFLGISFLATHLAHIHRIDPNSAETVPSQICHAVVGSSPFYFVVQWATFLILVLAANTSFADFPRLSAIAARDRHLPRWFSAVGDRLVFQNGIIVLALLAIVLELAFRGSTDALIPLYAIGVFIAFTVSQAGMVRRWFRLKEAGWRWRAAINGIGACMTALVAVIFAAVKFTEGAWVVLVIMPVLILMLTRIDHHYQFVRRRLRLSSYRAPRHPRLNTALVLVRRLDDPARAAVEHARVSCTDVRALHLARQDDAGLREQWKEFAPDIPLETAKDTGWVGALMDELYHLRTEDRTRIYSVILPGDLDLLDNGKRDTRLVLRIKWTLLHEPGVAVVDASTLRLPEEPVAARGAGLHTAGDGAVSTRAGSPARSPSVAGAPALSAASASGLSAGPKSVGGSAAPALAVASAGVLAAPSSSAGAAEAPASLSPVTALEKAAPTSLPTVAEEEAPHPARTVPPRRTAWRQDRHIVLLLVPGLHRGVVEAISYARQLGKDVRALHIELEPDRTQELLDAWDTWAPDIPLIIIESPYRQLREPLLRYVAVTRRQHGTELLTVVVPEFVAGRWWDKLLHNQSGLLLKFALQSQPNVVLANTRYFLDR